MADADRRRSWSRGELASRRPVWAALATLYADTAQSEMMMHAGARRLARSPYTVAELREILVREVHPVCAANLFVPAGEWVPFDEDLLERRIAAYQRSVWRWPGLLSRPKGPLLRAADGLFDRVQAIRREEV